MFVYNGDGGVDNPDGLIDVGGVGIGIENTNGAPIDIYNGYSSDSQSEIFAGGKYGIYARSRSDGDGTGAVNVYNYGLRAGAGRVRRGAACYAHSSAECRRLRRVFQRRPTPHGESVA